MDKVTRQWRISQGEYWVRDYFIIADSKEEALKKYEEYLNSRDESSIDRIGDPQFLNDIEYDHPAFLHYEGS